MNEREAFTIFLFYGMNLVAAASLVLTAFIHPDWPLAALVLGGIAIFAVANLMAAWQWLRSRRKPVAVLTRRYVCRKVLLVSLLGAALLFALYGRGASLGYLWYVGAVILLADVDAVAKYLWQRSYRARLRRRAQSADTDRGTTR